MCSSFINIYFMWRTCLFIVWRSTQSLHVALGYKHFHTILLKKKRLLWWSDPVWPVVFALYINDSCKGAPAWNNAAFEYGWSCVHPLLSFLHCQSYLLNETHPSIIIIIIYFIFYSFSFQPDWLADLIWFSHA